MESRECSLDRSYCVNLASCGTSSQARLGTRLNVVVGDLKEVVICEIGANVSKGTVLMTRLDLSLLCRLNRPHDSFKGRTGFVIA
ncbi:hypothetical protein [Methylomusa anaerophila]|nr:hypothetical protein [Methylomusa anaerophila]